MCRERPGLRCTPHALKILESARQKLDQVMTEYDRVKNGRNAEAKSILLDQVTDAQVALSSAERDYYASPGGTKDLQSQIESSKTSDEERSLAMSRLDLARYDKETQTVAQQICQKSKRVISPEDQQRRLALLEAEKQAAARWAQSMNKKSPDVKTHQANAAQAQKRRRLFEESLRRKAAGVSNLRYISVSSIPATGEEGLFLPLTSDDFGRAASYLPYGAYGKVTHVKQDSEGNFMLKIENASWRRLGRSDRLAVIA